MTALDLTRITIDRSALDLLPGAVAKRLGVLPLFVRDHALHVAIGGETWPGSLHQVESLVGMHVEIETRFENGEVERALKRHYPDVSAAGDSARATLLRLLHRALLLRASDIHIDPTDVGGAVRLRVDGHLQQEQELSLEAVGELTSAIKVMAGLDIAEKRTPLDGQLAVDLEGEDVNVRVATLPTIHGERITLRILSRDAVEHLEALSALGMSERHHASFRTALERPSGMVFISGPTGSGKTTTLYAALRHLRAAGNRHLLSIEDPVEMPLSGVTQVRVDAEEDRLGFAKALRSALRHDPDVIMLGEIRDHETADIAVKSALTGHLVLATVHANSAAGVITRLLDLRVSPFLLASTMRLSVAQRLVRSPCPHCLAWREANEIERTLFGWSMPQRVSESVGCAFCDHVRYAGRIAIYEMIPSDDEVRQSILAGADESAIARHAFDENNPSLRGDGGAKVLAGSTTVEEVERATLE